MNESVFTLGVLCDITNLSTKITGSLSGGGSLVGLSSVGGRARLDLGLVREAAISRSCSSYCWCCCCSRGERTPTLAEKIITLI